METGTPHVLFERRGPVAWVTFDRPEARNAMTFAMYDALRRVCEHVTETPDIRVLVLTGAGEKAFVAGTDISQFTSFKDAQDALDYEARIAAMVGRSSVSSVVMTPPINMTFTSPGLPCDPHAKCGVPRGLRDFSSEWRAPVLETSRSAQ